VTVELDLLSDPGQQMHDLARRLFPICRSLTGPGVRESLSILRLAIPGLKLIEVPSGTKVLDWVVPDEWEIREAWIADLDGRRLVDFADNNLHLVGYSTPVDAVMTREELEPHLYSLPDQPDAIPYVTSYYASRWGFCVSQRQREVLGDGPFRVHVDSDLRPGSLTYGECVLPGKSDDEVLLSTYICHPSMANNELSGPVVAAALMQWLSLLEQRRFTYRLVVLPETIGAIAYLAQHLEHLRQHVKAGWVLTCIGDERTYSYVPSRLGDTEADRVSLQVLGELPNGFARYSFLDRGSDERQWCSPGADLPVCSVMRSKYGTYPEYHTSLDDLNFVTPGGLQGGLDVMKRCLSLLEANHRWRTVMPGEPQLGRRGLYPTSSFKGSAEHVRTMMNVLAYCDGQHDVIDLCQRVGATSSEVLALLDKLATAGVISREQSS
jgi:aminopeptidase-like protein